MEDTSMMATTVIAARVPTADAERFREQANRYGLSPSRAVATLVAGALEAGEGQPRSRGARREFPMTVAAVVPDLDEIERKLTGRLGELNHQRQRLALDAIGDSKAAAKLADVEGKLGACEQELRRLELARAEWERREVEAREAEKTEQRQAAIAEVRRLQPAREDAARAVDAAAEAHVAAVARYLAVCREQQAALSAADLAAIAGVARPIGMTIEASFARALLELDLGGLDVWSRLAMIPPHLRVPLAESDAVPTRHLPAIDPPS